MLPVLLTMMPFALGTITPTMIALIVLFLTSTQGMVKSISFILGKYLVYVLFGILCLNLAEYIASVNSLHSDTLSVIFFLIFGLLLIALAIRTYFGEDDPDTPPPKIMTILDQLGPLKLFGLGIAVCFVQPRFLLLILAGASIISEATLPASESFIAILVLALLMVWVMIVPVVVYLVMGKRRNEAMKFMRDWLILHQRIINVVVMLFFGIFMIILGLNHLV